MTNSSENAEKKDNFRFDDLVRSERYFTATLLPAVLFHNDLQGVKQFIDLVEEKATGQHNRAGVQEPKGTTEYDFQDVEVITEFHIARDLTAAALPLFAKIPDEESEPDSEPERRDAPDLVIIAGHGLVVCEGKFFSDFNWPLLELQLISQRSQVCHLLYHCPQISAYRHVAIVPEYPPRDIGADAVLTWDDIVKLAERVLGRDHYVTARLRNAVNKYNKLKEEEGDFRICNYNDRLTFNEMREMCGKRQGIYVGIVGGEGALHELSLVKAENRKWKSREPTNEGRVNRANWLTGERWLEIVNSKLGS
jgi:hypothetical protein